MKREISNYMAVIGKVCTLLAVGLALAACGGSTGSGSGGGGTDTAGIGGTGIVVGKVTRFGSIYVNGKKYNTDDSKFVVDGSTTATQDDLELGMVVRLKVKTRNGKLLGRALEVVYDDEVQGPVVSISSTGAGITQRSFEVFGQTVIIDANKSIFKATTFAGIADDDIVEVSGFRDSLGSINATYVEKKGEFTPGSSEVELRGVVDQYMGGTMFEIAGTVINIIPGVTDIDVPGGMLADGMFVEVEGVIQGDLSIDADEIELEDEVFDDDFDEASLQGIISDYVDDSDFRISGVPIDAGGAQFSPSGLMLAEGLEVEVEGDFVGGKLIADEVELRQGEARIEARVQPGSVDTTTGSFEVYYQSLPGTVVVDTNAQTLFKDEAGGSPLETMTLGDLAADDFVRVEGQEVGGELIASVVKRVDDEGDFALEGAVDAFAFASWIEILGIRYNVDGSTEYEDGALNATEFFGQLNASGVGTLVEIQDDAVVYGVADEIEFED